MGYQNEKRVGNCASTDWNTALCNYSKGFTRKFSFELTLAMTCEQNILYITCLLCFMISQTNNVMTVKTK